MSNGFLLILFVNVIIDLLHHVVHETTMLLLVPGEGILCYLLLGRVFYEDSDPILDICFRPILACLVSWQFAQYWLVSILEEVHVVERIFVIVSPVQLEGMNY